MTTMTSSPPVRVERFDPADSPTAGRPCVLRLHGPEGTLAVHFERDTGWLWMFALGPRGGERGRLAVPNQRAAEAIAMIVSGERLYGGECWMWIDRERERVVVRGTTVMAKGWSMKLDDDAVTALAGCVRRWADAMPSTSFTMNVEIRASWTGRPDAEPSVEAVRDAIVTALPGSTVRVGGEQVRIEKAEVDTADG